MGGINIMNALDKLIQRYISEARQRLASDDDPKSQKVIYLVPSKRESLLEAVKKIESSQIFRDLVELTCQKYKDDDFFDDYYDLKIYIDKFEGWKSLVQNFFRRSGFYLNCFHNTEVNATDLCSKYYEAFQNRCINVRYLAPLDEVGFPGYDCIEFNSFNIKRFTEPELNQILNNPINEIFYPQSVWDLKKLSLFWFIEVLVKKDISEVKHRYTNYKCDLEMMRNPIDYPEEINYALYNLLLFDWDQLRDWVWEEGDRWDGFKFPFIAELDDNLIDYPNWRINIAKLDSTPREDGTALFTLYPEETIIFRNFVQHNQELLDEYLFNMWPFIKTSFEYLKKAFFTESFPNAPEQLLWHITSIEALLGEPKKGVTQLLFKRLSNILGETKNERKRIRDKFEKIYDIRCDLVHGNTWKEGLSYEYLQDARNFARISCLWFLYFLGIIKDKFNDDGDIPLRDDILTFIDIHGLGKRSISSIKLLFAHAPSNISLENLLKLRD
jgi:hypothetical protein